MNDSHHHHHDAVVRSVLSNGPETGEVLPPYLHEDSRRPYRWATLRLESGDIVDDQLEEVRADLLFSVEMVDSDQRAYVLLEHQSTPDRWMADRLRKYRAAIQQQPVAEVSWHSSAHASPPALLLLGRIWPDMLPRHALPDGRLNALGAARTSATGCWDRYRRDHPDARTLPPIESIVLYQGFRRWRWKPDSTNLFPKKRQSKAATPPMRFALIDQTRLAPEDVQGKPLGRLLQWAMMAVFRPDEREEILDLIARRMAEWTGRLSENATNPIHLYLIRMLEDDMAQHYTRMLSKREAKEEVKKMGGYRRRLLAEGRTEGRVEGRTEGRAEGRTEGERSGQVRTVAGFLKAGASWDMIETATGLNEARFKELQAQVAAQ